MVVYFVSAHPIFRMEALGPVLGTEVLDLVPEKEILGPVLSHVHCIWLGILAIETT